MDNFLKLKTNKGFVFGTFTFFKLRINIINLKQIN